MSSGESKSILPGFMLERQEKILALNKKLRDDGKVVPIMSPNWNAKDYSFTINVTLEEAETIINCLGCLRSNIKANLIAFLKRIIDRKNIK